MIWDKFFFSVGVNKMFVVDPRQFICIYDICTELAMEAFYASLISDSIHTDCSLE